jgi:transcriptional regulator of NAD metabolism
VHISEYEALMGYIYDDNMAGTMTSRNIDIEVENEAMKTIEKIMKVSMEHKIPGEIRAVLKVRPDGGITLKLVKRGGGNGYGGS